MISIQEKWSTLTKCLPPVGYVLRNNLDGCWLRIHSLPNGKRYSDNEMETRELLYRHVNLFENLFVSNDCYVVIGFYSDQLEIKDSMLWLKEIELKEFGAFNIAEQNDDDCIIPFYYSSFKDIILFESIIKDVANEKTGPIVFFSPNDRIIFAPYDGGVDLFFLSGSKLNREQFKVKYHNWLLIRSDGL